MHAKIEIGGYLVEFDRKATAACYAQISVSGPEACGCAHCRNWVAGRDDSITSEFRRLLDRLGIPSNCEIEVSEMPGRGQTKPHVYCGWYLFIGRIVSGKEFHEFPCDHIQLSFAARRSFLVPVFEGREACELHFATEVNEDLSAEEYMAPPKPKR